MQPASTPYSIEQKFLRRTPSTSIMIAAPLLLSVGLIGIGTGSRIIDPNAIFQKSSTQFIESVTPNKMDRRRSEPVHVQLISRIREGLRLNLSALASILSISRPTLYAWLQGTIPRSDALTRLSRLAGYAEDVRGLDISRIETLFHLPLKDGKNFLEILSEDREVDEAISLLSQHADARSARLRERVSRPGRTNLGPSNEEVAINFSSLD